MLLTIGSHWEVVSRAQRYFSSCQLFCQLLMKNAWEEARSSEEVRSEEGRDDTAGGMLTVEGEKKATEGRMNRT